MGLDSQFRDFHWQQFFFLLLFKNLFYFWPHLISCRGFPGGSPGKESACQFGIPGFDSWVGKIPWRREWLSTPVFWPGEFHSLCIVRGVSKSQKGLSNLHTHSRWNFPNQGLNSCPLQRKHRAPGNHWTTREVPIIYF